MKVTRRRFLFDVCMMAGIALFLSANLVVASLLEWYARKQHILCEVIHADVFTGSVVVENIRLSAQNNFPVSGDIGSLSVTGLNWIRLVMHPRISIRDLSIHDGRLVMRAANRPDYGNQESTSAFRFKTGMLQLDRIELRYAQNDSAVSFVRLHTASIAGINLSRRSGSGSGNFLWKYQSARIEVDSACWYSGDSLYVYRTGFLRINSGHRSLEGHQVQVIPRLNPDAFARKARWQTDRISLYSESFFAAFHTFPHTGGDSLLIRFLSVDSLNLEAYRDKRIARKKNDKKPTVQELLQKLSVPFSINRIYLTHGAITYIEKVSESYKAGSIVFSNVTARISRAGNYGDSAMTVEAGARLMHQAPCYLRMEFPSRANFFNVHGLVKDLPLQKVNAMSGPNAGVEFTAGVVHEMFFDFRGGSKTSEGLLIMKYDNLDLLFKDKKTGRRTGFLHRVMTFTVDKLLIPDRNPDNRGNLKQGRIAFERDDNKFIFNYLWKSIFSGIQSTFTSGTVLQATASGNE